MSSSPLSRLAENHVERETPAHVRPRAAQVGHQLLILTTRVEQSVGQDRRTLKGHTAGVTSVAFTADGLTLASGSADVQRWGELKLWDVTTGQERPFLTGRTQPITSVAFTSDGRTLASASREFRQFVVTGEVKLWDVPPAP